MTADARRAMFEAAFMEFHQYESDSADDRLILFAAPARELWRWAGIPRQGWQIRMLYQRWLTDSRKSEVTTWWNEAGSYRPDAAKSYLVGPTALTLALQDEPVVSDGKLILAYDRPWQIGAADEEKLAASAEIVLQRMRKRLTDDERAVLDDFLADTSQSLPDLGNEYVLEGLCQIGQMARNVGLFISQARLGEQELTELIESLEALARPALIVDGQHRLYGAAHSKHQVWLPVVAIPDSPWMEQIYQFVVINDKAQRVPGQLLTDIFGSSLTLNEQRQIREQLERSRVNVEERIAAVIAARDTDSPFHDLVRIGAPGTPPSGTDPFIPEATIRQLIEGGRGTRGWRTDPEFYDRYVKATYPNRADWDSWTDGAWRTYWLGFWEAVRDHYNDERAKGSAPLWDKGGQTNLTKAISLRLFQRLFIEKICERMRGVENSRDTLVAVLGEEEAEEKLAEQIAERSIPSSVDEFKKQVREWFLKRGVPVRVFEYSWKSSLDDASGQQALYDELEKAFDKSQHGEVYRAQNSEVYAAGEG